MVGHEIWHGTLKNVQKEKHTLSDLSMAINSEKCEKGEMQTVGSGIWREN